MKNLITLLAASCFLFACSKSDNNGGGGTPSGTNPIFEKSTSGTWYSECAANPQIGPSIEMLTLAGGKGSITYLAFQTQDCSDQSREAGKVDFTYRVLSVNGATSKLSLKIKDQQPQEVSVIVNGDAMSVTGAEGTKNYNRPPGQGGGNNGGGGNPQNPGGAMAAFDAVAKGIWATDNCYEMQNGGGTAILVLEITGNGKASQIVNTYNSADCSGDPRPGQKSALTYTVDQFAGGQGQLTLNGQAKISISVQGTKMVIQDQGGTFQYSKIR